MDDLGWYPTIFRNIQKSTSTPTNLHQPTSPTFHPHLRLAFRISSWWPSTAWWPPSGWRSRRRTDGIHNRNLGRLTRQPQRGLKKWPTKMCHLEFRVSIKTWRGPYQRTPKTVTRAIKYPGLGVRSVGPVGNFLEGLLLWVWGGINYWMFFLYSSM